MFQRAASNPGMRVEPMDTSTLSPAFGVWGLVHLWRAPDIKFNDCIQFVPSANLITIRLCGEFLFDSGQADVKAGFAPVAADIARFLNSVPGPDECRRSSFARSRTDARTTSAGS